MSVYRCTASFREDAVTTITLSTTERNERIPALGVILLGIGAIIFIALCYFVITLGLFYYYLSFY